MSTPPSTRRRPAALDHTTSLCLACSASLPPRTPSRNPADAHAIFTTPCCARPICPACVAANPRLTRYDPCIRCLGGVGALSPRSPLGAASAPRPTNVDGSLRDRDVFVLEDEGGESESGSESAGESEPDAPTALTPPPAYAPSPSRSSGPSDTSGEPAQAPPPEAGTGGPPKYYIRPNDTLVGIALKLGVDGRILCRINGLPPSTLRTTPHLLHTRVALTLPPSARAPRDDCEASQGRAAQRERERAEKRVQTLTKEADWRVAKAYVAVAAMPDADDDDARDVKAYEGGVGKRRALRDAPANVEERALDRYLDDDEWEAQERRAGRRIALPAFPYLSMAKEEGSQPGEPSGRSWWQWSR